MVTHVKLLETMLHIITPLYRFDLLPQVYESIPKEDDIIWHISVSTKREPIPYNFIYKNDKIKLYYVDCLDNDTSKKRNEIFSKLTDGYFCFLDDDTIFHENMYKLYLEKQNENFVGMVVGNQVNKHNKPRLNGKIPRLNGIDTGNVLCHTSCLEQVSWPRIEVKARDGVFWINVYEYYNKNCSIKNEVISIYNKLR